MAELHGADAHLYRLRHDFPLYARVALRILSKDGTVIPLKLNRAQLYIHERLERQREETGRVRALVLKGRQQGCSTLIEARYYWRVSGEQGRRAYILAHEQAASDNLFAMARRYHDLCPPELRPQTSADSAKALHFSLLDSGYRVSTAGSRETGRSATAYYFHGSEFAFWSDAEAHLAGIGQTVPDLPGTEIVLESTANGTGNLFHRMWSAASRGESDYQAIFVPWHWQEEYTRRPPEGFELDDDEAAYADAYGGIDAGRMAWRRAKIATDFHGDASLFDQEYPASPALAFRRSLSDSLIQPIDVQRARAPKPDLEAFGPVLIGVDPAEYGRDSTAIAVRVGRRVMRIEAHRNKGPMEVAGLVAGLYHELKPAGVFVDVGGVGTGVHDRLIELGYPVTRVHFGGAADERERYANKRAEMYGRLRDWLLDTPCEIPDDDALEGDLTACRYKYDSSRRLQIESKEDMRRRGVHSPDRADALALTFAYGIHPSAGSRCYEPEPEPDF